MIFLRSTLSNTHRFWTPGVFLYLKRIGKAARLVNVEHNIRTRDSMMGKDVTETDIVVDISANGKTHRFKIDDCVLMNSPWFTWDGLSLKNI